MIRPAVYKVVAFIILLTGIGLTVVNLYGLTRDVSVRPLTIGQQYLRFENDVSMSYEQAMFELQWRSKEDSADEYIRRVNRTISQTLAHIHWEDYEPERFHQTIPVWENYFLYLMAKLTTIPEYDRYHFADYRRSLRRGIGICGDASMIMSQVLDDRGIANTIISFPGHIVVSATHQGQDYLLDPDFGVLMPYSTTAINKNPELIRPYYKEHGHTQREIDNLVNKYGQNYKNWDGVSHFITKKYYFEKLAYALKWPLPIALILFGLLIIYRMERV